MKTYLVAVDGQYVDVYEEALNGYSTSRDEKHALVLTYAEAVELSFKINKSAGRTDKAVMIEAIEDEEYEAEDDKDEHQKRADAMMTQADDSRDDR